MVYRVGVGGWWVAVGSGGLWWLVVAGGSVGWWWAVGEFSHITHIYKCRKIVYHMNLYHNIPLNNQTMAK